MGFFKKEVVVLKDSTALRDYLARLEALYADAPQEIKPELEKEIKITQAGIVGEDNIMYELKNSGMDLVVLHDLYLQAGDLSAQIDFFVISPKINFIIECKNLYGNIEINSKGDFIRTYTINGRTIKEGIYSPITQNERHLRVAQAKQLENSGFLLKASNRLFFENFHKSLVVLANPKTVLNDRYAPKEVRQKVFRADQLVRVIKEMNAASKEVKSSFSEMVEIGNKWLERCTEYDGFAERYEELEKKVSQAKERQEKAREEAACVNGEKPPLTDSAPAPSPEILFCPRCGQQLVLRTARKGERAGRQFYGCSAYPRCRYILNL